MVTVSDDFNRVNGALAGSTTPVGSKTWVVGGTGAGTWSVSSNTALCSTGFATAYVDCGTADGTWSVDLVTASCGLIFRLSADGSSGFLAYSATLYSVTAYNTSPTFNPVGSLSSALGAGDTVSVVTSGSSIVVKQKGTTVCTITSTVNQSETRGGMHGNSSTAVDNFSFDAGSATHALGGAAAVILSAVASFPADHNLVGSTSVVIGGSGALTVPLLHPLSGTAAVVVGGSGVLFVPVLVFSTADGARSRSGAVVVHMTHLATASASRERSGNAYPVTVDASGLVSGTTFRRWTFVDPVTLATYTFEVNPNAATPASAKRPVDGTPTTARDGVPITFQGERDVPVGEFSGSLLSKEQHEAFVAWWMKQREILLIDDLGNEHYVLLAKYSPERVKQTARYKYRQKYTMQYLLMSEPV